MKTGNASGRIRETATAGELPPPPTRLPRVVDPATWRCLAALLLFVAGVGPVTAVAPVTAVHAGAVTGRAPVAAAQELGEFEAATVPRHNVEELGRLPAFSHATTVGDLVFVSGTLGTRPGTIELVEGGVGPETAQTMANIRLILEAAGSSLDRLAKCTVYLVDLDDFDAMNAAWLEAVGDAPPARATVGVAELVLGAAVEIECIAAR